MTSAGAYAIRSATIAEREPMTDKLPDYLRRTDVFPPVGYGTPAGRRQYNAMGRYLLLSGTKKLHPFTDGTVVSFDPDADLPLLFDATESLTNEHGWPAETDYDRALVELAKATSMLLTDPSPVKVAEWEAAVAEHDRLKATYTSSSDE
jgi:hypothetical protein